MLISSSNPDNDLATQARHIQHAKHVILELRITCICSLCTYCSLNLSINFLFFLFLCRCCLFEELYLQVLEEGGGAGGRGSASLHT